MSFPTKPSSTRTCWIYCKARCKYILLRHCLWQTDIFREQFLPLTFQIAIIQASLKIFRTHLQCKWWNCPLFGGGGPFSTENTLLSKEIWWKKSVIIHARWWFKELNVIVFCYHPQGGELGIHCKTCDRFVYEICSGCCHSTPRNAAKRQNLNFEKCPSL